MKKSVFLILIIFSLLVQNGFSTTDDDSQEKPWHLLEMGKLKMEQGEFGEALSYANQAQALHKKQINKMYSTLFNSIKPRQVQKEGDNIFNVYKMLKEREDYDACGILDEIFLTHPPIFFEKSMSRLMDWLKKRDSFPETDFLTGQIFFAEGEYEQALHYYKLAWEYRLFLEIPDLRFKIIYAMADTSKLLRRFDAQEKYLLLILTEDPIYGTTNFESQTLKAMVNTIKKEKDVEKFFLLYRHSNKIALKAYIELTDIYMQVKNYDRALATAVLASIIVITNLDNEVQKIDYTYKYSDFSSILYKLNRNTVILKWAEENNFWRSLLNLADCLKACKQKKQAKDLYKKMARSLPAMKYAQEAAFKENEKE